MKTNCNEKDYRDHLPSWSWMIYSHIQFHKVKKGLKVPAATDLRFGTDHRTLLVQVHRFLEYPKKREGDYYILEADSKDHVGVLWFDDIDTVHFQYCVVIGIDLHRIIGQKNYYILLVRERGSNQYERVGLGKVSQGCICREIWDGELI
jgi:hypothetical protein